MVTVRYSAMLNAALLTLLAVSALLSMATHPRIAVATVVMAAGHVVGMLVRRRRGQVRSVGR